jgi:hypothetical protein
MALATERIPEDRAPCEARVSLPFADGAPEWIMWMPGGLHSITCRKNGKPLTLSMRVDAAGASAMQECLSDFRVASRQRPFFDFDHDGKAASAWPMEFAWRDEPEPGIYARVEWSDAGRAAVAGKRYRAFSPKWYETDTKPAEVAYAPLNMGGLVNDPAFREIATLWASRPNPEATQNKTSNTDPDMTDTEKAALQARIAELELKNSELTAAAADGEKDAAIEAANAEKSAVEGENRKLKEAAQARAERDADACIASAISRGAIAPKDEEGQKRWKALILADPANAELLAKQAGKPAITAGRIARPAVEVLTADTNDVLRGYLAAHSPRDKGLIYVRDISPRIAKGENVFGRYPVEASNTLGTLINAMVSQRTLELVTSKRPMLKGVVTDFSDEVRSKGDTVKTRTVGLPTMQDFGGTVSETADADVTVTLDLMKEVKFTYAATEIAGTARDLVTEHAQALAVGLGNGIVDAMAALLTESNFSTTNKQTIKAAASCDFTTVTAINKAMNTLGVPDTYRFGWVNSDVAEAFVNDELIMANFDRSPIASAYAHWTNVKGFADIWEYPALPANSVNLIGFFAHRSALIVAARIPANPTTVGGGTYIGRITTVTDPISGLSVVADEYTDSAWNVSSRLVALFGVDVGNATCGHTLVSAA